MEVHVYGVVWGSTAFLQVDDKIKSVWANDNRYKKNVGIDNGINNHTNHLFIKLQPSKHNIGTGND